MATTSIASLNTRGLNDPVKCLSAFNFLQAEGCDIFLLQECNIPYRDNYKTYEDRWTFGQSVWSGDNSNRSSGVAILFKGWGAKIQRVQHIIHGRVICVDIELNNTRLRIINVYCPVDLHDRLDTLKAIQPLLLCGNEVVLGGDFNCLIDIKDRLSTSTVRLDSSSEALKNIVKDFRMTDTYRVINPRQPGFTWSNGRTHSRIDFILTSKGLQVTKASATPAFFSDHQKIECTLVLKGETKKGKGAWKLNTSLLKDKKVVNRLKEKLELWPSLQFAYDNLGEWWEDVKVRIKHFFIEAGRKAAKTKRFKLKKQQAKLQRLYTMAHTGYNVSEEIASLKREMLRLSAEASRGLLTRSRVKHLEENEKCTRYFFRKLVRPKTIMEAIKDKDGNVKKESKDILTCVRSFYAELYKGEDLDRGSLNTLLSKVNKKVDGLNDMLENDLTIDELTKALNSMQDNKSPGADGLPKEFYSTFWAELKGPLLEMYNESLRMGTLPPSLREGTISLLFKKGEKNDIRNWRPLTLLGVDRKLLAKALFFRLQVAAGEVVGEEQTCVIPGRSMGDSLALARDSYLYALDRRVPLCIAGLDLEKAFDRINHAYLKEVLMSFGFGPRIRAWIDLLYHNCKSRVIINGNSSDSFMVQSGVRQGCPLSVVLFILAMEPLACAIRQDHSIRGLLVPGSSGSEAKMTLYMDDMSILCTDNASLVRALEWSDIFSRASGAKLNRAKSECLYLNWYEDKVNLGLKEKIDRIKVLGIEIGKDMAKVNWESRLPKIKGKLLRWKERELTFTGKMLVIKAEIYASLTFLAATLPVPREFLTQLRREMFRFLWGSQQERVKREIMYRPKEKGGKAVPELGTKLEALFLTPIVNSVLMDNATNLWSYFARFWVGRTIATRLGKRLPLNAPHAETRPKLYGQALKLFKSAFVGRTSVDRVTRDSVEKSLSPQLHRLAPVGTLIESECIKVWKNVNSQYLLNSHKDVAWSAVHNCIPTRAFLHRRRCSRSSICPRANCNVDENVCHLFWFCPHSQRVWVLLRPWLDDLYRIPTVNDVMYGELHCNDPRRWVRWWAAINCTKEAIWKCRNVLVFKKFSMAPEQVAKLAVTIARDYLLKDKEKHSNRELTELWKVGNGFVHEILKNAL